MFAFQQVQQQFIQHIKDPDNHPVEGIEDRRLAIYRELFFNNIVNFVSGGFPVLHSLYTEQQWTALVRDFFIVHDCHSPYFVDIAKEFIDYLTDERQAQDDDYPFLVELAHYEWVELAISIRDEKHFYPFRRDQSLTDTPLVLSETAWPLSYSFAVHQISIDNKPEQGQPGSVHLVVYRDSEDNVQFMQINGVTAILMQLLTDNPGVLLTDLLAAVAEQLTQFSAEVIYQGGLQVVESFAAKGIIRLYQ